MRQRRLRYLFFLFMMAMCILPLEFEVFAAEGSSARGEQLTKRALSLRSKKIESWLKPVLKKYGRKVFKSKFYQEKLKQKITEYESTNSLAAPGEGIPYEPSLKSRPAFGSLARNSFPMGPPTEIRERPSFPMYFGMLGLMTTYSGQETTTNNSASMGGGAPGGMNGLGGNTQSLMASANMMIAPSHSVSTSYMHSFIKDLPAEGVSVNNKGTTLMPPKDVFSVGYSYAYRLTRVLRYSFNLNYSGVMGFNDSNLSLTYNGKSGEDLLRGPRYSMGLSATLPLSQESHAQGKVTTVSLRGNLQKNMGAWNYQIGSQYSYSFYNKAETAESILESFPGSGSFPQEGPPPDGGSEFPGSAPASAFPSIDINLLSRETARTNVNSGIGYRFDRHWNAGSKIDISYRYLESTYSFWTTSLQIASLGYQYGNWNVQVGTGLRSDSSESLQTPKYFSMSLSLVYMFGAKPPGGSTGAGGSSMKDSPDMGGLGPM